MPTIRQRVDHASISATFLPLPKGKKRGRGVGFCGGDPVASVSSTGNTAPPFRWVDGKPELITFPDVKTVVPLGTSASQLAGLYYTPKQDERALVWTRAGDGTLSGVELHPDKGWQKSSAAGCGDGQQVGYGYERFVKDPSRALLWTGSRESLVVLTGPDSTRDTAAKGVAQGVQVGTFGNSMAMRACLWRGTPESYVDLHPDSKKILGSEAYGAGDGQQVGHVWSPTGIPRAALWSGSAESFVDLTPRTFKRATAWQCARGFQVGWAYEDENGPFTHALLWNGDDGYVDLQHALPEPWNLSQAMDLDVAGDTLRILGTAQQYVQSGGYDVKAAEVPVLWEMKLLIPEPPARRESPPPPAVKRAAGASRSMETDEQKVERAASAFARALVDDDYEAAHGLLAPWLAKQVTPQTLRTFITRVFLADTPPVDFVLLGIDSKLEELREHYQQYYKNDPTRTLASATESGDWGPPSIYIADEITPANFRQWMSFDLTPELDHPSGLDYLARVWITMVDVDGTMKIGYVEAGY